jgi:hypothetical protein
MPERIECGDCPPDGPCTVCNGHGYLWLLTVEEIDEHYFPSPDDLRQLMSTIFLVLMIFGIIWAAVGAWRLIVKLEKWLWER